MSCARINGRSGAARWASMVSAVAVPETSTASSSPVIGHHPRGARRGRSAGGGGFGRRGCAPTFAARGRARAGLGWTGRCGEGPTWRVPFLVGGVRGPTGRWPGGCGDGGVATTGVPRGGRRGGEIRAGNRCRPARLVGDPATGRSGPGWRRRAKPGDGGQGLTGVVVFELSGDVVRWQGLGAAAAKRPRCAGGAGQHAAHAGSGQMTALMSQKPQVAPQAVHRSWYSVVPP